MHKIEIKHPKNQKLIRVKEISQSFACSTTVYGLTRVLKAESSFLKLAWTLMTLISAIAGFGVIYETVQDYNKNDVFTHTKRLQTGSSILPAVTFCTEDADLSTIFQTAVFTSKNGSVNMTAVIFEPIEKLGYTSCAKFNNYRKNTSNGQRFFTSFDTNSDKLVFEIRESVDFRYLDVFFSDNYLNTMDWIEFVATIIPKKSNIVYYDLTKKVETKLGEPYNDCKENIVDVGYNQRDCLVQCNNNRAVHEYNCTPINYYRVNAVNSCRQDISESLAMDEGCQDQCPKECTIIKYETLESAYSLDGGLQSIEIAYLDLSYIEISQSPKMNGFTLISEIGGALGLFVGITFLSCLELLEYLSEIFLILYF